MQFRQGYCSEIVFRHMKKVPKYRLFHDMRNVEAHGKMSFVG